MITIKYLTYTAKNRIDTIYDLYYFEKKINLYVLKKHSKEAYVSEG